MAGKNQPRQAEFQRRLHIAASVAAIQNFGQGSVGKFLAAMCDQAREPAGPGKAAGPNRAERNDRQSAGHSGGQRSAQMQETIG